MELLKYDNIIRKLIWKLTWTLLQEQTYGIGNNGMETMYESKV